jgi:glycolate oxidase
MEIAFTPAELQLFRDIKKAFDPNGILNPGKMGL